MNQQQQPAVYQPIDLRATTDQIADFVQQLFLDSSVITNPATFTDMYAKVFNVCNSTEVYKFEPRISDVLESCFVKLQEHIRSSIACNPCEMDDKSPENVLANTERGIKHFKSIFSYQARYRGNKIFEGKNLYVFAQDLHKKYILDDDLISRYIMEHKTQ